MSVRTDRKLEKQIIKKYKAGMGAVVIGQQLGIGSSTIYHVLERAGIQRIIGTRKTNRLGLPKFTKEKEVEIASLYKSGQSYTQLAKQFGATLKTIGNICIRNGVQPRKRGPYFRQFTKDQLAEINRRWQAGESQTAIARILGVSQIVISRTLRLAGFKKENRKPAGSSHGNWKGGRYLTRQGYIFTQIARDDPYAAKMSNTMGYVQEHRYVMAQHLGRPLESYESIHHINGDRTDNRIENLQLRHGKHGSNEVLVCRNCGSSDIAHVPID